MIHAGRKIKNWQIPKGKKKDLTFCTIFHHKLSPRLSHCLRRMNITQYRHFCIPDIYYATKESWSTVLLNQPNLGRKAYRELVVHLISVGLQPIHVEESDDSEDSMTGGLMR